MKLIPTFLVAIFATLSGTNACAQSLSVSDCSAETVRDYCIKWFEARNIAVMFASVDSVGGQGTTKNMLTGQKDKIAVVFYIRPDNYGLTLSLLQYGDLKDRKTVYKGSSHYGAYQTTLKLLEKDLFDYCRITKALSAPVVLERPSFSLTQTLAEVQREIAETKASGLKLVDTALTEGRINPRITKIIVQPVKRFTVEGAMALVFDKPDIVTTVIWFANNMAVDDFKYIHNELVNRQGKEDSYEEKLHIDELHYWWHLGPMTTHLSYNTRDRNVSLSRTLK